MANSEKISIIIPTYNREKLIKRSIQSVLKQTYKNIEIIVVDDASTDNTKKVVKSIRNKKVKYIRLDKNQGACHARNIGLEKATGEYIAFQDSDDIFHNEKLEEQLKNLKKNKADLDFCKICINQNDTSFLVPNEQQEINIKENKILDELCNGNFISTQAILVKKDVFKKYLFDESMSRLQDYDLVLRMANDIKISYTNKVLVDLYTQDDSIGKNPKKLRKAIILFFKKDYNLNNAQKENLINWLLDNNPDSRYYALNEEYIKLLNEHQKLIDSYNGIINSKRWKVITKICNIKNK